MIVKKNIENVSFRTYIEPFRLMYSGKHEIERPKYFFMSQEHLKYANTYFKNFMLNVDCSVFCQDRNIVSC